ncbi:hypothetical protein JCM10207_007255 [Rhodosporidiobolus poonsookiae]
MLSVSRDEVAKSPRADYHERTGLGFSGIEGTPRRRRNSFDQPFSPLLPQEPETPHRATFNIPTIPLPNTRPRSVPWLQLAILAVASLALYRTFSPSPPAVLSPSHAARSSSAFSSSSPSRRPPSPLNNPTGILGLSPVVVGPRTLAPQYHGRGCNSSQLISAVGRARIRPDGASRNIDTALPGDEHSLAGFRFSYNLGDEGCPEPHLYSKEEACDLLKAYGGVMLRGDSFVRHVVNALFILLSGKNGGAVVQDGGRCRGNAMFDDRKAHCREMSVTDSQKTLYPVCGGDAHIFFDYLSWGAQPPHLLLSAYDTWRWSLPAHKAILSHVYIAGFGLHHHLNSRTGILGFVRPFLSRAAQVFPRPVGLWMGIHAPAPGKPERWAEEQGEKNVRRYNREVGGLLDVLAPGEIVEEDGAMKMVDWFNTTDGGKSYDGSHYAYQINMEKVLVLLNLLDTVWGEAVDAGGLLETY